MFSLIIDSPSGYGSMSIPGSFFRIDLSREQIYEMIFGFDGIGDSSAISEHVKNIRAKFQKFGENPIATVWGIGYKWD